VSRPPLLDVTRYLLAKAGKVAQRMSTLVGLGVLMVALSPVSGNEERERFLRTSGAALAAWSWVRWHAKQTGQRLKNPKTGEQLRQPTVRMPPEKVDEIRRCLDGRSKEENQG